MRVCATGDLIRIAPKLGAYARPEVAQAASLLGQPSGASSNLGSAQLRH